MPSHKIIRPEPRRKEMSLSAPLPRLFFSLPSQNFLKHANTILSFHMQKVHVTAYIPETCGMFIHWGHQQVPLSSIFSPRLIPKLISAILSAKGAASDFSVHCSQHLRILELWST